MIKIAPSLLSANFMYLDKEVEEIKKYGVQYIHYDVMDGHFVPNISFGYSILSDLRKATDLYLDVHLMISDPLSYVDKFIEAGADLITFHIEAMGNDQSVKELIDHIHQCGKDVGISIKPATPISVIEKYLDDIDLVLVMSVEPGFGGQSFQNEALEKIKQLHELRQGRHYLIEVDGGINQETAVLCREAGVDIMVAGSYIFYSDDYQKAIDSLR